MALTAPNAPTVLYALVELLAPKAFLVLATLYGLMEFSALPALGPNSFLGLWLYSFFPYMQQKLWQARSS